MIVLPTPLAGSASGWSLVDFRPIQRVTDPAAGGVAQLELDQLASDELWVIDHAVVACSSATPTQVRWYANVISPAALLDGSSAGNFDVGDWPAGLTLYPGTTLIVVWSGATDGAIGALTLQTRVLRRA